MSDFLDQFDKVPVSQKLLLLVLLMLGVVVAYFFIFHTAMEEELANQEQRHDELTDERVELEAGVADIDRIRDEIRELCVRQGTFLEALPPREEIPSLLQSINQQAELTRLQIETFERSVNVPGPNYTTIPVVISLQGTYDQVTDFFFFIGRAPRVVNVENIDMEVVERARAGFSVRVRSGDRHATLSDFSTDSSSGESEPFDLGSPHLRVNFTMKTYFAETSTTPGAEACAD